ncbi:caspase family protein [Rhizobium sp. WYCCWR 11128]|uniref:caspase family protein n=1 Tax=Rhizobium sp. WYCCWR 11128 TaxID=2749832 RepID=UPI0015D19A86|nr:caspase family protein [Rhizobium sp. WYCCWR 11128]NYT30858.1 hypothetical protein [Rhizobium sp. WYCCWR 11128]
MSDIDLAIDQFLEAYQEKNQEPLTDLIIYYVGHGSFTEDGRKYCILLRNSRFGNLSSSAYRMTALALTVIKSVPAARRFVILDACYSAAAAPDWLFLSSIAEKIEIDAIDAMAETGTALLCASSPIDVAVIIRDEPYTMFSGALIKALESGSPTASEILSFEDIREIMDRVIRETYRAKAVRSQLQVPDQRKGNISRRGIFPNPSFGGTNQSELDVFAKAQTKVAIAISEAAAPAMSQNKPHSSGTASRENIRLAVRVNQMGQSWLEKPSVIVLVTILVLAAASLAMVASNPSGP